MLLLLLLFLCVPAAVVLVFLLAFLGGCLQILDETLRQVHADLFGGR